MFYSNKIFEDSHQEAYAGIFTSLLGLILILSTVYGAIISEKLGRRVMIMKGNKFINKQKIKINYKL